MILPLFRVALIGFSILALTKSAYAECHIDVQADIPVRIDRGRILIPGEITGQAVEFAFDTGAPRSLIFSAAAVRLKIPTRSMPSGGGGYLSFGGPVAVTDGAIQKLNVGPLSFANAHMLVGGKGGGKGDMVGFLGYDLFARHDIEIDPEHNRLRLIDSSGCSDRQLVYWGGPFHVAAVTQEHGERGHGVVDVKINGVTVAANLDTGMPRSTLALDAAANAGVTPSMPGAVPAGYSGFNGVHSPAWAVKVKTLQIGDEIFDDATIRISNLYGRQVVSTPGSRIPTQADSVGMNLGVDFLGTRRLIISRDHSKLLFSDSPKPNFPPPSSPSKPDPISVSAH